MIPPTINPNLPTTIAAPPPALDYCSPGTRDVGTLASQLRGREAIRLSAALASLLIGVPLLFVGPLVMSWMFWVATTTLLRPVPWWPFLLGACFIFIPLLVRLERSTRGNYFAENAGDLSGEPEYYSGPATNLVALAVVVTNPREVAAIYVEVFLTGPRLVLDVVDQRRALRVLNQPNLDRAAMILGNLLALDEGTSINSLRRDDETLRDLDAPLAYLIFHDWIGIAKDRQRVWMLTDARRRLQPPAAVERR